MANNFDLFYRYSEPTLVEYIQNGVRCFYKATDLRVINSLNIDSDLEVPIFRNYTGKERSTGQMVHLRSHPLLVSKI